MFRSNSGAGLNKVYLLWITTSVVANHLSKLFLFAHAIHDKDRGAAKQINDAGICSWTTIVGWHPGASAFHDATEHEAGLYLFFVGGAPER